MENKTITFQDVQEKVQIRADELFPCEKPCDTWGLCTNCYERMVYLAGIEKFGPLFYKAGQEELKEVGQKAVDMLSHALYLGYLGEGSTMGWANDVLKEFKNHGIKPVGDDE